MVSPCSLEVWPASSVGCNIPCMILFVPLYIAIVAQQTGAVAEQAKGKKE